MNKNCLSICTLIKYADVVRQLDSATKIMNLISASNDFNFSDAWRVLLQKFHAEIKFIGFIALSGSLATQANFNSNNYNK